MSLRVLEVRVGQPRGYGDPASTDPLGKPWRSAIGKEPVPGPLWLTTEGLAGDAVADRRHHGGPDQAVLAYAAAHYPRWRAEGLEAGFGGFGENLVVEGVDDHAVCLGDRWRLGDALLEVSQPRVPCNTLHRRFRRTDLVPRVFASARGGWYLRVLEEGHVGPGPLELVARPFPEWSVARVLHARRDLASRPEEARAAAALPPLSALWRELLSRGA